MAKSTFSSFDVGTYATSEAFAANGRRLSAPLVRARVIAMATTVRLPPMASVRDLVRLYRLRAVQQLSQNFLLDAGVCSRLARAAGPLRGATVCEVGAGPGSITRALLREQPAAVTVIEKDARFLPLLLELRRAAEPVCPLHIVAGDVLRYDMAGEGLDSGPRAAQGDPVAVQHVQ